MTRNLTNSTFAPERHLSPWTKSCLWAAALSFALVVLLWAMASAAVDRSRERTVSADDVAFSDLPVADQLFVMSGLLTAVGLLFLAVAGMIVFVRRIRGR